MWLRSIVLALVFLLAFMGPFGSIPYTSQAVTIEEPDFLGTSEYHFSEMIPKLQQGTMFEHEDVKKELGSIMVAALLIEMLTPKTNVDEFVEKARELGCSFTLAKGCSIGENVFKNTLTLEFSPYVSLTLMTMPHEDRDIIWKYDAEDWSDIQVEDRTLGDAILEIEVPYGDGMTYSETIKIDFTNSW